jgi:hypothetical protein
MRDEAVRVCSQVAASRVDDHFIEYVDIPEGAAPR